MTLEIEDNEDQNLIKVFPKSVFSPRLMSADFQDHQHSSSRREQVAERCSYIAMVRDMLNKADFRRLRSQSGHRLGISHGATAMYMGSCGQLCTESTVLYLFQHCTSHRPHDTLLTFLEGFEIQLKEYEVMCRAKAAMQQFAEAGGPTKTKRKANDE